VGQGLNFIKVEKKTHGHARGSFGLDISMRG
jgi:hypothetical protein